MASSQIRYENEQAQGLLVPKMNQTQCALRFFLRLDLKTVDKKSDHIKITKYHFMISVTYFGSTCNLWIFIKLSNMLFTSLLIQNLMHWVPFEYRIPQTSGKNWSKPPESHRKLFHTLFNKLSHFLWFLSMTDNHNYRLWLGPFCDMQ